MREPYSVTQLLSFIGGGIVVSNGGVKIFTIYIIIYIVNFLFPVFTAFDLSRKKLSN